MQSIVIPRYATQIFTVHLLFLRNYLKMFINKIQIIPKQEDVGSKKYREKVNLRLIAMNQA